MFCQSWQSVCEWSARHGQDRYPDPPPLHQAGQVQNHLYQLHDPQVLHQHLQGGGQTAEQQEGQQQRQYGEGGAERD